GVGVLRREEARPPAVGVELGGGAEQLSTATAAPVDALPVLVEQLTGARAFGAGLPQHVVLLGRQPLPPLILTQSCRATEVDRLLVRSHGSILRLTHRFRHLFCGTRAACRRSGWCRGCRRTARPARSL